jgi:hypothetical protein
MKMYHMLLPGLALLAACSDSPTAPSADAALTPAGSPAFAREATIRCSATSITGGWRVTLQWDHVAVRNVTLILEDGSVTVPLDHLRRKGSVDFAPASGPVSYVLDNGKTTTASGGCAAP